MQHATIQYPTSSRPAPTELAATELLRTVTGNRFPRKSACGCGRAILRDPEIRYVVNFGSGPGLFFG